MATLISKALSIATGGNINAYLPAPLASDVIDYIREISIMRGLIDTFKQNSRTWKRPKKLGTLSAYHVPDGTTAPFSSYSAGSVEWEAKKLMAFTTVDEEAIEDSIVDVINQVMEDFAESLADSEEQAILEGDPTHLATSPTPDAATTANWYVFDPRTIFKGIFTAAAESTAAGSINAAGLAFDMEMVNTAIFNLGKYGRKKSNLHCLVPSEQAANIRSNAKFQKANEAGILQAAFITGLGSAGEGNSIVSQVYGINVYEAPYSPAGQAVVYLKKSPLLGDRRMIKFKNQEVIETDQTKYVVSERISFNFLYQDALCLIKNLSQTIVS